MKIFLAVLGALVALFILTWMIQGQDFFMYKFWAPKYEDVRRDVFEHTKSYRSGMTQELQNMQMQYIQADQEHKDAIASIILRRAAEFGENNLSKERDLYAFVQGLKRERGLK